MRNQSHKQTAIPEPPPAKTPTREELLVIANQAHAYIKDCIKELEPATSLGAQVQLGMLVKLLKTYHNLLRIIESGDSETPAILARGIYEYSLSLVYMIVNDQEDPEIYEKFRQSALARSHIMLKNGNKSTYRHRQSSKESQTAIENMLASEGYDIAQKLPDIPKSWHPEMSYQKMAQSLGVEFKEFYHSFYEVTSIFVHPNWLDIKTQLIFDSKGGATASLYNQPQPVHPIVTATCLILRTAVIFRIELSARSDRDKDQLNLVIDQIRRTHYSLHN